MRTRHVQIACAAIAAPFALALTLAGIRADAMPPVLENLPPVPWPLTIPAASASAPIVASAPSPKAAPAMVAAKPVSSAQPAASASASAVPDAGFGQCCAALRGRSQTAREDARSAYAAAANTCDAVAASTKARSALGQVRAHLQGAELPFECR